MIRSSRLGKGVFWKQFVADILCSGFGRREPVHKEPGQPSVAQGRVVVLVVHPLQSFNRLKDVALKAILKDIWNAKSGQEVAKSIFPFRRIRKVAYS